jgi:hypothetical protein
LSANGTVLSATEQTGAVRSRFPKYSCRIPPARGWLFP